MNSTSPLPPPVSVTSRATGLSDHVGQLFRKVRPSLTPSLKRTSAFSPSDGEDQEAPPNPSPSYDITEADVLEQVNAHRHFRQPAIAHDIAVTDLPVFDSITQYEGASEEMQARLWAQEVSRLVEATNSNEPLEFKGSPDLAVDSAKSHEILATLADIVFQSLNISLYDGECLLAEYDKSLCSPNMKTSRISLDYLCNRDDDDNADNYVDVSRRHRKDIFAFVDSCTAVMARIMCGEAEKKSVAVGILSQLSKLSTKVKVVSANPQKCAQMSIDNGDYLSEVGGVRGEGPRGRDDASANRPRESEKPDDDDTQDQEQQAPVPDAITGRQEFAGFTEDFKGHVDSLGSREGALRWLYMNQCSSVRAGVLTIFLHLVLKLRGNKRLMRSSFTRYEICSMIHETGFERFPTLVFQDQDSYFSGSASPLNVGCASRAYRLLDATVRHLEEQGDARELATEIHGGDSVGASDSNSIGTKITWSCFVEDVDVTDASGKTTTPSTDQKLPRRFALRSMNNVISVLIPLFVTDPINICQTAMFLTIIGSDLSREGEVATSRPSCRVSASFCLDTEEYREAQRSRGPDDSKSLSNSLIRRNGLLAGKTVDQIGRVRSFPFNPDERKPAGPTQAPLRLPHVSTKGTSVDEANSDFDRIRKNQQELDTVSSKMQTWVLEEKGVMVRCRLYVSSIMLLCAVLVAGGITLGVTVGERIDGVDPFNITTYCWVLAAFVVLVAKSVRVHEWPWNDFLHGRVLCKSVSELSSVTGIREQIIIAYLLQTESTSYLQTRGPFNSVFRRRSDDGFSIDTPLRTWTMLLSGLLMIEVESVFGRGLVCLDLRRGTTFDAVPERPEFSVESKKGERAEGLVCRSLQEQGTNPRSGHVQIRLQRGSMGRFKTIGLYVNQETVFI